MSTFMASADSAAAGRRWHIIDDDVVAGVGEGGVGRLVLTLKQSCRDGGDASEHLSVGIDDVPAASGGRRVSAGHERRHP